ncbi:hypothetical protein C0Q70_21133 [Pomacea canaliculata]|uniref:Major facilitator superfamily (MFS) profile domain-containing protein n=1 Tax=Pomacea canaliculata TaxID=400727 RepID=A0A2T7NBN9_POMCA|nr:hypothetical protein C0Q70_21133 [Pomacea canaliculata]
MRKAGWDSDVTGLPIDRGYAWVIAFSCLFCNLLSLGVQRAYGILFVEFLRMFQMSAGVTAVILSAQSAVTSIAALLTQTVVLSFLSVRQTVVMGGFLGGLGLILSYFAESIYMLYFTISVLVGLSLAMILGPAVVIVGMYFEKRRSLASAIATLGGNLGSTIMPIFAQELIDEYGGRSALLLLGGTNCVFSLICQNIIPRPLLTALLMAACSVAGLFTPLYTSFTSLIIFCVVYGLFGPVFFSMFPVVIIDILGLKSLSTTLGFVQLFQGVVVAAVHPIIDRDNFRRRETKKPLVLPFKITSPANEKYKVLGSDDCRIDTSRPSDICSHTNGKKSSVSRS